ncbi:MAG: hypothetical protein Ta2E_03710 [Mycoplasmoidaceae bacterium]|nr:MAG: hypothetical protein Ta2E_03710 [Mycoplasmoidaceae bacterium]
MNNQIYSIIIQSLTLLIICFLILYITLVKYNFKFIVSKKVKPSNLFFALYIIWFLFLVLICVTLYSLNLILIITWVFLMITYICMFLTYILIIMHINKTKSIISYFFDVDFRELIKKCNINSNIENIKSKITKSHKSKPSIVEQYKKISEDIKSCKKESYLCFIDTVLHFNTNNQKWWNVSNNKLVYKFSLYLLWDIQNNSKTK